MPLIEWIDDYSVGIEEIDNQHKKLVSILNELHESLKWGKGEEQTGAVLDKLVKYTVYHFKYEEKLFDTYDYPDSTEHKRFHTDLVHQVSGYYTSFREGNTGVGLEIYKFLKNWLFDHILGSDKRYAAYLNQKGVS